MGEKRMFVGIRFPDVHNGKNRVLAGLSPTGLRDYFVVTATNLKGLCGEIGLGYARGRKLGLEGGEVAEVLLDGRYWLLKLVDVEVRISGRGGLRVKGGVDQEFNDTQYES